MLVFEARRSTRPQMTERRQATTASLYPTPISRKSVRLPMNVGPLASIGVARLIDRLWGDTRRAAFRASSGPAAFRQTDASEAHRTSKSGWTSDGPLYGIRRSKADILAATPRGPALAFRHAEASELPPHHS